jgi:hypothetical protein
MNAGAQSSIIEVAVSVAPIPTTGEGRQDQKRGTATDSDSTREKIKEESIQIFDSSII